MSDLNSASKDDAVEFLFDPLSPYTWLAWHRLGMSEVIRTEQVRPVPVLFAALLDAHGTKGPAEVPARRNYVFKDVLRWCQHYGITCAGPPAHPFNPLPALRMVTAIAVASERRALTARLLKACWQEGLDISDDATLDTLAQDCALEPTDLRQRRGTPETKERLRENTARAIERGVFGVPTMFYQGELFFGHDRIGLLEAHIKGLIPVKSAALAHVLSRPRAAERPQKGPTS